jgi:hypothetical protein
VAEGAHIATVGTVSIVCGPQRIRWIPADQTDQLWGAEIAVIAEVFLGGHGKLDWLCRTPTVLTVLTGRRF